ncbi:MAG: DUF2470 domain-containing protein [Deinococcota bacterium]
MTKSVVSPKPHYPSHAETARSLAVNCRHAVLASVLSSEIPGASGQPYTSVIDYAVLEDGSLITLLSDLAEHSRNLQRDGQCSLFIQAAHDKPLEHPRTSLIGRFKVAGQAQHQTYKDVYLARHPQAERYIAFSDFQFYHFSPTRAYTIAGFGRMGWCDAASYHQAEPDPLINVAAGAISHMNEDHKTNLQDYAKAFLGLTWAEDVDMLSLDRYGFDVVVRGQGGEQDDGQPQVSGTERVEQHRISFAEPLGNAKELRAVMVKLANEARARLAVTS